MSGLALVAHELGAKVTGSDRSGGSSYAARLREAGIEPAVGHDAANVPAGAEVVYSTAIPPENPERARRGAERELHRADLLGELTRLRPTIAVSGTHGKTTTSSMLVHALRGGGAGPVATSSAARCARPARTPAGGRGSGSSSRPTSPTARCSSSSARSRCSPTPSSTTTRPTPPSATSRRRSARSCAPAEQAVVWDRPALLALAGDGPRGLALRRGAEAVAGRLALRPRRRRGRADGPRRPQRAQRRRRADRVPRRSAPTSPPPPRRCATSRGAGRRFEHVGTTPAGALVVDDYAHHPTEVRATLEAARTLAPRRVVAVFQPHLYSRTQALGARVRRRARARRPAGGDRRSTRRASAPRTTPASTGRLVAEAAADAAGGRRVAWLPDFDSRRALPARRAARGRPAADARRGRHRRAGQEAGRSGSNPRRVKGSSPGWSWPPARSRAAGSWLRDSSLVEVRDVFVTGVSSSEEPADPRGAQDAALDMTTLHVREDALRAAVGAVPVDRRVRDRRQVPAQALDRRARARAGRRDRRAAAARSPPPATGACCAA